MLSNEGGAGGLPRPPSRPWITAAAERTFVVMINKAIAAAGRQLKN